MLLFLHLKNLMFWKKNFHRHKYISTILSWMTIFALICVSIFCSCLFFFHSLPAWLYWNINHSFSLQMRWGGVNSTQKPIFHLLDIVNSHVGPFYALKDSAIMMLWLLWDSFYYQFFYYIFLHSAATGTVFVVHHCYWYSLST